AHTDGAGETVRPQALVRARAPPRPPPSSRVNRKTAPRTRRTRTARDREIVSPQAMVRASRASQLKGSRGRDKGRAKDRANRGKPQGKDRGKAQGSRATGKGSGQGARERGKVRVQAGRDRAKAKGSRGIRPVPILRRARLRRRGVVPRSPGWPTAGRRARTRSRLPRPRVGNPARVRLPGIRVRMASKA